VDAHGLRIGQVISLQAFGVLAQLRQFAIGGGPQGGIPCAAVLCNVQRLLGAWQPLLVHQQLLPRSCKLAMGIGIAVGGYAFLYGLGILRDMVGDFYVTRKAMVATGPIRIKERQTTPSGHTATSPIKKSANWFVSGLPIQAFSGDGWT
jgi:hypothetical protein